MLEWTKALLAKPGFYLALLGLTLFAYGVLRPLARRLPFLNKRSLMLIGIGGFLITSGVIGSMSLGSVSDGTSGTIITDLQVTTDFTTDTAGNGNLTENANQDDLLDVRLMDSWAVETAGSEEVYTGVITVTRAGDLEPNSCTVSCRVPPDFESESSPDGTKHNILEKTTQGAYECYLADGAAATVNSPKETVQLSFSDGEASTTLGVAMEVDEEGHDFLNQYSYKDVVVDVCGKGYVFRIHRMD